MANPYFDNSATSYPKPPTVAGEMAKGLTCQASGITGEGISAGEKSLSLRERLCRLFNFDEPSRAVIIPGATFGLNLVLRGVLRRGDHCLVSQMEHNSVIRTLSDLGENGVEFDRIPCNGEGFADFEAARTLIKPNTVMLMLCHASNVCGSLQNARAFGELCAERGMFFALDAAQSAGCYPIDFADLRLSALVMPAHKGLLGPMGIGAVLLSDEIVRHLRPLTTGGTGSVSQRETQPDFLPDRFESGSLNVPGMFGWDAALEWIEQRGIDSLYARIKDNTAYFLDGLEKIEGVELKGTRDIDRRLGVISLCFAKQDPATVARRLQEEYHILTRTGLHCAPGAHRALGTYPVGTVRFSLGHNHTRDDIDAALKAIAELAARS